MQSLTLVWLNYKVTVEKSLRYLVGIISLTSLSLSFYQVTYNPQGSLILTASSDKTARLWDPVSGNCVQVSMLCTITTSPSHSHSALRAIQMRYSAVHSTTQETSSLRVSSNTYYNLFYLITDDYRQQR